MNKVLVLDSHGHSALSIVRSLGRHDVSVTAGADSTFALGPQSKYAADSYVYPDPDVDCYAFLDHLTDHLTDEDYAAVVPATDKTTALLARHKVDLERTGTKVATEDWETFSLAYDKSRTFDIVEGLDVPAPTTVAPTSPADLDRIRGDLSYPVVVKSRSKSIWTEDGTHELSRVDDSHYADSPDELDSVYRTISESSAAFEAHPPLIQEYVPGETQTTVVLADRGEVLVHFQERRLRTDPPSGGNSTLLSGVRNRRMFEHARELIEALEWTGPAQVEFMRTPGGQYRLIEMNGRYWGSLPLAINSGVDFPWYHYQLLRGERPDPPPTYRTDVLQRRLLYGDINWLGHHLAEGNVGAVGPFLRAFVGPKHTFVSVDDPRPTAVALGEAALVGTRRCGAATGSKLRERRRNVIRDDVPVVD
ncbi:carboxylate--amine ligase [Halalkalicoccus jeotgali]|uniref:ATP-grasp enzyme-like protein n=1 Tax=Halalkalicoccus jeotgali (strain DSM 18796 / CECT 7217 / JCM 14584 / KCTC 4019 / B3) TaxID=795797 RepID=D8J3G9_HALJB|nr:ATP-grasp domain-containing protein [Halalkalicoccus jeotgali]ADJ15276.1 ATP-grasp enzyme-like protein [Halalkalicoccus jeotgali B3]ELY35303.1 ATP-grasp enzyme-like protein [Halalkalicoccus jeotgali B3]